MGFRDALAALLGKGTPYQELTYFGPTVDQVLALSPEELYRTQPHLRTVVSFLARNCAQLRLPVYRRISDTDRERVTDSPVVRLLNRPNPDTTRFELFEALVSDMALYDIAYWFVGQDASSPSGWFIRAIPPAWVVATRGGSAFAPAEYEVLTPGGKRVTLPAENVLVFHGWNPGRPKVGASPIEALRQVLAEQINAWQYRLQIWQRGGRVGAFITRPADAPAWSPEARKKFQEDWSANWTGNSGPKAGGTPLFEDGMKLERLGFSAREDEWIEAAKLSLATVASMYHVNPVMVGLLENANYSNTKEFRKMLYGDTLGSTLERISSRINAFLLPLVDPDPDLYCEFNIAGKISGDFEEQAAVLSTSVGAPWMTRNEARARQNLPAVDGGDELVTPLNVLLGGQASPRSPLSASRPKARPALPAGKNRAPAAYEDQTVQVLRRFFARQRDSVLPRLGAGDEDWWDGARWDRELAAELLGLASLTTSAVAADVLERLGFPRDSYDLERTLAFLRSVAESRAGAINAATRDQLEAVVEADDPDRPPASVFAAAEELRAPEAALALITTFSAFAATEAAEKATGGRALKTWLVTSGNPRPEHAAMAGETVPVGQPFSNGAQWPGDPVLGADGVAGCLCGVEITLP